MYIIILYYILCFIKFTIYDNRDYREMMVVIIGMKFFVIAQHYMASSSSFSRSNTDDMSDEERL